MSIAEENGWLHPEDAAKMLGVARTMLDKLRREGTGPAFLRIGRKVFYEPDAIRKWVEASRTTKAELRPGLGQGKRRRRAA